MQTKSLTLLSLVSLLLTNCCSLIPIVVISGRMKPRYLTDKTTSLYAVAKKQVAVYDGSELASIISFLKDEGTMSGSSLAARAPRKAERIGAMKFVTGTIEGDHPTGQRVVRVQIPNNELESKSIENAMDSAIQVDEETFLYADSVSFIPPGVSDEDAISTAAVSVCGVHCGKSSKISGKCVVVGGSDYAIYLARALHAVGTNAYLITTRPILTSDNNVEYMNPAVGKLRLPFTDIIGSFDSFIDTLEDEANLFRVSNFTRDNNVLTNQFVLNALKHQYNCTRYISTVTHSQRYVLSNGLLFARDPVLRYQNDIEKQLEPSYFQRIRPPLYYGNSTLQKILDAGIVYKADKNENGPHATKNTFVRGWTLSDLAELKTWPRVSSKVRFGFPVAEEINQKPKNITATVSRPSKAKNSQIPFISSINDVKTLNELVVSTNSNAVLFFSASYCRTCKKILPLYQRMARTYKEDEPTNLVFGVVDIASGNGKQLGTIFEVDVVPSFLFFNGGEQFGKQVKVKKLPSTELDTMVQKLLKEST